MADVSIAKIIYNRDLQGRNLIGEGFVMCDGKLKSNTANGGIEIVNGSYTCSFNGSALTQNCSFLTTQDDFLTSDSTIQRSKLSAGTNNNYILANNGSAELSEQQFVTKVQGGFNSDISGVADGFLKFGNSGELQSVTNVLDENSNIAVSKITEIANIANSKYLYKDSNGDLVGQDVAAPSNIVDNQIDDAASISRLKIAADESLKGNFLFNHGTTGKIESSSYLKVENSAVSVLSDLNVVNTSNLSSYKRSLDNMKNEFCLEDTTTNNTPKVVGVVATHSNSEVNETIHIKIECVVLDQTDFNKGFYSFNYTSFKTFVNPTVSYNLSNKHDETKTEMNGVMGFSMVIERDSTDLNIKVTGQTDKTYKYKIHVDVSKFLSN